jgi:hypothetical protein
VLCYLFNHLPVITDASFARSRVRFTGKRSRSPGARDDDRGSGGGSAEKKRKLTKLADKNDEDEKQTKLEFKRVSSNSSSSASSSRQAAYQDAERPDLPSPLVLVRWGQNRDEIFRRLDAAAQGAMAAKPAGAAKSAAASKPAGASSSSSSSSSSSASAAGGKAKAREQPPPKLQTKVIPFVDSESSKGKAANAALSRVGKSSSFDGQPDRLASLREKPSTAEKEVDCPICGSKYPTSKIEAHASGCLVSSSGVGSGSSGRSSVVAPAFKPGVR